MCAAAFAVGGLLRSNGPAHSTHMLTVSTSAPSGITSADVGPADAGSVRCRHTNASEYSGALSLYHLAVVARIDLSAAVTSALAAPAGVEMLVGAATPCVVEAPLLPTALSSFPSGCCWCVCNTVNIASAASAASAISLDGFAAAHAAEAAAAAAASILPSPPG